MRLQARIINTINNAVQEIFGDANVYLFGSGVDDTKKGGDIDIAIESELSRVDFRHNKARLIARLLKVGFDF